MASKVELSFLACLVVRLIWILSSTVRQTTFSIFTTSNEDVTCFLYLFRFRTYDDATNLLMIEYP